MGFFYSALLFFKLGSSPSKWKLEFTAWSKSKSWIYFYIGLNKNFKIYWSEQGFIGIVSEDQCSLWGLGEFLRINVMLFYHLFKKNHILMIIAKFMFSISSQKSKMSTIDRDFFNTMYTPVHLYTISFLNLKKVTLLWVMQGNIKLYIIWFINFFCFNQQQKQERNKTHKKVDTSNPSPMVYLYYLKMIYLWGDIWRVITYIVDGL